MHDERQYKRLLKNGVGKDLFLDGDLEFDSAGVGLGPDEGGVDEPNFHERSRDLFEAYRWKSTDQHRDQAAKWTKGPTKQFTGLGLGMLPCLWGGEESLASPAEHERRFFRDTLGDIDAVPKASDT